MKPKEPIRADRAATGRQASRDGEGAEGHAERATTRSSPTEEGECRGAGPLTGGVRMDALQCLADLRAAMSRVGASDGRNPPPSDICSAIDQIMVEHEGLAEELLGVYEQLGVVFAVTRRLPEVQSELQIVDLFVDSLRRSFAERTVFVARVIGPNRWTLGGRVAADNEWFLGVLERAVAQRGVIVEPSPEGAMPASIVEVMVAPVLAGATLVCAIVFVRAKSAVAFRSSEMLLMESLATFCGDLIRNHRLVDELGKMSVAMVRSLVSAVDQKDQYTCGHSLRVAFYATELGTRLKLSRTDLRMLQWGALLHDVGKIGIRDEVLKKGGGLTEAEFRHIEEHPVRSHRVVAEVPQLAEALEGILYHHEHYDGTGYPEGRRGEAIPLKARIIQIADVFDALTSDRSYRRAYRWEKALQIMQGEAGKTVDPHLSREFDGLIREQVGSEEGAWERMVNRANHFTQAEHPERDRAATVRERAGITSGFEGAW